MTRYLDRALEVPASAAVGALDVLDRPRLILVP